MGKLGRIAGTLTILTALTGTGLVARGETEPVKIESAGKSGPDLGEGFCVSFGENDDVYLMQGKETGPHGMQPVPAEEVKKVCGEGFGE